MERWFTGTSVVLIWGAFNTILASILAGFTAAGVVGGPGPAGALGFVIYAASTTLVFAIGLVIWAGRRRVRGRAAPPRPAAALLLAVAVAMAWTGLAVGPWAGYLAIAPALTALFLEFYPPAQP